MRHHVLVAGCGPSVAMLADVDTSRFHTFGVNDVGRHFTPDDLVVSDQPGSFGPERRRWILETKAARVWVRGGWEHLHHPDVRTWKPVRDITTNSPPKLGPADVNGQATLMSFTTAFAATHLAYRHHCVPELIGLVGVDIIHHHALAENAPAIVEAFKRLRLALLVCGTKLVNLSDVSCLTGELPRGTLDDFRPKGG